jgi:deoxyhypusine monooxygenase
MTVDYPFLKSQLLGQDVPLSKRFRALFTLKSLKSDEAVDIIGLGKLVFTFGKRFL